MHGKEVLGQIDSTSDHANGLPFRSFDVIAKFHHGNRDPLWLLAQPRDGEVKKKRLGEERTRLGRIRYEAITR